MVKTPALDHMAAQEKELRTQEIGEFLEWAQGRGMVLCRLHHDCDEWWPVRLRVEQILAEYAEVDLEAVDRERRAILEAARRGGA